MPGECWQQIIAAMLGAGRVIPGPLQLVPTRQCRDSPACELHTTFSGEDLLKAMDAVFASWPVTHEALTQIGIQDLLATPSWAVIHAKKSLGLHDGFARLASSLPRRSPLSRPRGPRLGPFVREDLVPKPTRQPPRWWLQRCIARARPSAVASPRRLLQAVEDTVVAPHV